MIRKKRSRAGRPLSKGAGFGRYLKEALFYRWNMLLLLGGVAVSLASPWPDILFPLVATTELIYLVGLVSIPKFRAAIEAKAHQEARPKLASVARPQPARTVAEWVSSLPREARCRFVQLHSRCLKMRSIAHGVSGRMGTSGGAGEDIRTPALDRLLWVFLRLLVSQNALNRFLETTSEAEISHQLEQLLQNLADTKAEPTGIDKRIIRSLQDSVAVNEIRLENYRKAERNAEFVAIELDRIEGKIQVLTETSVNRQDPGFLSNQVDSVAESLRRTETAISELQHITGLTEDLEEPPPILESDLRDVLRGEA